MTTNQTRCTALVSLGCALLMLSFALDGTAHSLALGASVLANLAGAWFGGKAMREGRGEQR